MGRIDLSCESSGGGRTTSVVTVVASPDHNRGTPGP